MKDGWLGCDATLIDINWSVEAAKIANIMASVTRINKTTSH